MERIGRPILAAAVVLVIAVACGSAGDDDPGPTAADGMRVASANFAENELLAEMYAQVIESTGTKVVRLGPVGPREIIAPALELDLIDLVPEYLGTVRQYFGAGDSNPDTASAWADLDDRLAARALTALRPSPAQNKNVFVVRATTSEELGIREVSDLFGFDRRFTFGGTPECPDRQPCLLGLRDVYGLEFADFVSQPSTALRIEALRREETDVALMFSTDPDLNDAALVVLEDDRGLQPAENVLPVVRTEALERWGPDVERAIDEMSRRLTTVDLRILNRQVADGADVATVAARWLGDNQLLGSG